MSLVGIIPPNRTPRDHDEFPLPNQGFCEALNTSCSSPLVARWSFLGRLHHTTVVTGCTVMHTCGHYVIYVRCLIYMVHHGHNILYVWYCDGFSLICVIVHLFTCIYSGLHVPWFASLSHTDEDSWQHLPLTLATFRLAWQYKPRRRKFQSGTPPRFAKYDRYSYGLQTNVSGYFSVSARQIPASLTLRLNQGSNVSCHYQVK